MLDKKGKWITFFFLLHIAFGLKEVILQMLNITHTFEAKSKLINRNLSQNLEYNIVLHNISKELK